MRLHRRAALAATIFAAPICAAAVGCSGDDTAVGAPGEDAGADTTTPVDGANPDTSTQDNAAPDATGADTSSPDATPTPDAVSDSPIDTADAADAGPVALIRVAWFAVPGFQDTPGPLDASAANASPDASADAAVPASPTYDVCVAPHGTQQWQGPLLASAGSTGLSLYDVSTYFPVPVGQWDVRVVFVTPGTPATCAAIVLPASDAGDAGDAGATLPTDFTNLPALTSGQAITAVVTPSYNGSNPLNVALVPLLDEAASSPGLVGVRFANVSGNAHPDPLAFGLGGGALFTPWFTNVTSSETLEPAVDGGVDPNGYLQVFPFAAVDTTIMDQNEDLGSSGALTAPSGTVLSAFAVPGAPPGEAFTSAGLVVCYDGQTNPSSPLLTNCTPASINDPFTGPPTQTRFANFIANYQFVADQPTVDICLKYHSLPDFTGQPLSAAAGGSGTPPATTTPRYDIHGGLTYDVRVVLAGATDCSTPIVAGTDTTYQPAAGLAAATVALTGYLTPIPDGEAPSFVKPATGGALTSNAFTTVTFGDLACGEVAPVVRAVNLDSQDMDPIVLAFLVGTNTAWSVTGVPYGTYEQDDEGGVALDACGYLTASPATGTLSEDFGPFAPFDFGSYTITPTTRSTIYMVSTGGQPELLVCDDGVAATPASCTLLQLP